MRPVMRGLCSYESLRNCVLSLYDVALMNDAITIEIENSKRGN